jgi:hypothetical protein
VRNREKNKEREKRERLIWNYVWESNKLLNVEVDKPNQTKRARPN